MDDRIERLERLARLRDTGALTPAEFEIEKARLFGGAAAVIPAQPAGTGRHPLRAALPPETVPYAPSAGTGTAAGGGGAVTWLIIAAVVMLFIAGGAAVWMMGLLNVPPPKGGAAVPDAGNELIAAAPTLSPTPSPSPSASPTPTDFSTALGFANAAACEFAPDGDRLYSELLVADTGTKLKAPGSVTIADYTTKPAFSVKPDTAPDAADGGKIYESSIKFGEGATWNGLKLSRALVRSGTYQAEDSWTQHRLTFLSAPDAVAAALGKIGLTLTPAGDKIDIQDGNGNGRMWLEKISGGTALVCDWRP